MRDLILILLAAIVWLTYNIYFKKPTSRDILPAPQGAPPGKCADKTCRSCAMQIPAGARICPYCRTPQRALHPVLAILLTVFIITGIFGFLSSHTPQSKNPVEQPENKENTRHISRALAGAATLKKSMRNPASFALTSATVLDDGTACYEYRAQNGFGGMDAGQAVLDGSGDDLAASGTPGFPETWNRSCAGKSGEDVVDYLNLRLH